MGEYNAMTKKIDVAMKQVTKSVFIAMMVIALFACDRLKQKTGETTHNGDTGDVRTATDTSLQPFDHDKPDTENNRKRFREFLKVELTPDVRNIYCFDDELGIEADYMFAFNCDSVTSAKIIRVHRLTPDRENKNNCFDLQQDFAWWDKKRIARLPKYVWTDGLQNYTYYWYDRENKKAYYFDFDVE